MLHFHSHSTQNGTQAAKLHAVRARNSSLFQNHLYEHKLKALHKSSFKLSCCSKYSCCQYLSHICSGTHFTYLVVLQFLDEFQVHGLTAAPFSGHNIYQCFQTTVASMHLLCLVDQASFC